MKKGLGLVLGAVAALVVACSSEVPPDGWAPVIEDGYLDPQAGFNAPWSVTTQSSCIPADKSQKVSTDGGSVLLSGVAQQMCGGNAAPHVHPVIEFADLMKANCPCTTAGQTDTGTGKRRLAASWTG